MNKKIMRISFSFILISMLTWLIWAPSIAKDFSHSKDLSLLFDNAEKTKTSSKKIKKTPDQNKQDVDTDVWIIMDKNEAKSAREALRLSEGEIITNQVGEALFSASLSAVSELVDFMLATYKRAPGFFAYDSKEEALKDLYATPAPAPEISYTIDQQEKIVPMVAQVSEKDISATITKLESFYNRYYTSSYGINSSKWIAAHWGDIAKKRPDIDVELYNHSSFPQDSIILTIKGTKDPDKVVVIGGHADSTSGWWGGEDSRAPGADDNGSGIAVITEALRVIVASGYHPSKTIKLMGFAAEEVGLRGSREIAAEYGSKGMNVVGMANFDMTNFKGSPNDIYLLSDNTSRPQNTFMGNLIDEYVNVPWGWTECGYGCSDHASWTKQGFAASTPFETAKDGMNGNIHTSRDTLANCGGNASHSTNFAKLAIAYLVEMAK
ncbi:M20/M25/M40 family metallo-hydrolase [Elusimicrobiota bacterium]